MFRSRTWLCVYVCACSCMCPRVCIYVCAGMWVPYVSYPGPGFYSGLFSIFLCPALEDHLSLL